MYDTFFLLAQTPDLAEHVNNFAGPAFDSLGALFRHVTWRVLGLFVLVLVIRFISLILKKKIRERA